MKRVAAIILATALLLTLFVAVPFTAEAKASGDYEYNEQSDGTAVITKYKGSAEKLAIPSKLDSHTVKAISSQAFEFCDSITSVTIPDSVTDIGSYAFAWSRNLATATIGKNVKTIGEYAFSMCRKLNSINVSEKNGSFASKDGNLYNKSKTQLLQYALGKESKSFTIPGGVTKVGDSAFENCETITSIKFSDSVASVGKEAFGGCTILTSINVPEKNSKFSSENGVLYNKNKTKLVQYPIGKTEETFTIPKTVTAIGDNAFGFCDSLTSIVIPDNVKSIGDVAFGYCENLTSAKIGNGVTSIGARAFDACEKLSELTLGNNVKKIGYIAFISCKSLKSVTIPYSLTDMYCDMEFGYYLDFSVEGHYAKVDGFTIRGYNGTLAEKYAKDKGFEFVSLGDVPITDISKWNVSGIKNMTYTGEALTQKSILVSKDGKIADVNVKYKNNKNVGTATATITGTGYFKGKITKTFKITKAANPVKVSAKATVTAKANKKTTIKKAVTVKSAQGKVTYTTSNKKVTVKSGAVTVAKGFKKGKTLKVKVTVTAKGNGNYKSKKIVKTIKIKIK